MAYLLAILMSPALAAVPPTWSWRIDGSPSSLAFTPDSIVYSSPLATQILKKRPCSSAAADKFRSDFEQKFAKLRPAVYPKDYEPVFLAAPGKKEIPILRGEKPGVYLMTFDTAFFQFLNTEKILCRKR